MKIDKRLCKNIFIYCFIPIINVTFNCLSSNNLMPL